MNIYSDLSIPAFGHHVMNVLGPKTGTLQVGPQEQDGNFLVKGCNENRYSHYMEAASIN
jgi:hypothetical protein